MMTTEATPEALTRRLVRGSIGGLVGGAVFIATTMWFAATMGQPADAPLSMISTIVKGEEALAAGTADPAVGLVVHAIMSVAFGASFGLVAPMFKTNGTVALAGTLYGGVLYVVNFLVMAPIAFPVFKMANQPFEVLAHLVFGLLTSLAFFGSGTRRGEPVFATGTGGPATAHRTSRLVHE